jgi:hypothetical protein
MLWLPHDPTLALPGLPLGECERYCAGRCREECADPATCGVCGQGQPQPQPADGADAPDPGVDPVCFGEYATVSDDPDLRTSTGGQGAYSYADNYDPAMATSQIRQNGYSRGNDGLGVFGLGLPDGTWYRLPDGHGLATSPPGVYHCGASSTGWLSGFGDGAGPPDMQYVTPADGSLPPPVGAPPADGWVCFDSTGGNGAPQPCGSQSCPSCTIVPHSVRISAVSCGPFALWSLPDPIDARGYRVGAYCLAP